MLKTKILSIGRFKEKWLIDAIDMYIERLSPTMKMEWVWAKDNKQLMMLIQDEPSYICLDPQGKQMTSEMFSQFVFKQFEKSGSRITFVIGGADGLPEELRKNSILIGLSSLTFTHQITQLILIEQLYRAHEIHKGGPYHKA